MNGHDLTGEHNSLFVTAKKNSAMLYNNGEGILIVTGMWNLYIC